MSKVIYLTTPEFRVSFPTVFKPRAFKGKGEEKFSINMLFPKSTDLTELKEACKAWAKETWGDDLKGIKWPFKDGDVKGKKERFKMYQGMIWCVATSKHKPQVIQPDAKTYIYDDPAAFYPGCWARCEVHPFYYENEGRGISLGLGNIQKTKDDDKFAGRPDAKDQFDPVETGSDDPANYDDDMIDSSPSETIEL